MDEDAARAADGRDRRDGLDRPDLAVGRHDGDEDRLCGQGLLDVGRVDPPDAVDGEERRREAQFFKGLDGIEDRRMFDGRDDDVPAPGLLAESQSLDGKIIGFGPARSEINFGALSADEPGDFFACRFDGFQGPAALGMQALGIPGDFPEAEPHGL